MCVLSKRLHSIFMLRLFNDGFAVFLLFAAVFAWQRRMWTVGSMLFSFGLGVKMSLLLALPAVGPVLLQGMGRDRAMKQAVLMAQVQVGGYVFSEMKCWHADNPMIGDVGLRVPGRPSEELHHTRLRVQPPVHVQVDGQLAIRW